jgi:hypothetical protein
MWMKKDGKGMPLIRAKAISDKVVVLKLKTVSGETAGEIEFHSEIGAMRVFPGATQPLVLRGDMSRYHLYHREEFIPVDKVVRMLDVVRRVAVSDDPATVMIGMDLISRAYMDIFDAEETIP